MSEVPLYCGLELIRRACVCEDLAQAEPASRRYMDRIGGKVAGRQGREVLCAK